MAVLLFVSMSVFLCYLAYRLDLWKQLAEAEQERYHEVLSQLSKTIQDKVEAEGRLENMQRYLASIATRPIYAAITEAQVEMLGKFILAGTGKKEYLN